jgi:DNA-3-methyladenine glycosylase II
MRPIRNETDIENAARALVAAVPAFAPVLARAGSIPLRFRPPGYEGLAHIIVAQMVSRASADAIWARLEALTGGVNGENVLARSVEELRAAGLSGAKEQSLRALAQACRDGLDLERIASLEAGEAIAALTAIRGIGLWTAEVFLLFSAGHPDIFPAGDVALQSAAAHAFQLPERPKPAVFRAMAEAWRPYRSIAARVLWAYYGVEMKRSGTPVA